MGEPIYMRVGNRESVDLNEFMKVMGNFLGLLREVDSAVADRRGGHLRWNVTTLRKDPVPLVGVTPIMRRALNDTSDRVEREVIGNVVTLTKTGERNRFLSDDALMRVERIAVTAPKLGPSAIYIDPKGPVLLSAEVTTSTLNQVQELTSVKSTSLGALIGSLGSISVRRGRDFRVWDDETGRPVTCRFKPSQEEQAKKLLGQRVMVVGMINADRQNRPVSMSVDTVDPLPEENNLPTIEEMVGLVPNFTGGLSLREFFEDYD